MSVGSPGTQDGRRVIAARGEAETSPWLSAMVHLKDDYQVVFDPHTLLPLKVLSIERGIRERTISTTIDGRTVYIEFTGPKLTTKSHLEMPELVRDPLSALFALRAAPLHDGDRLTLDILDGMHLWRASLRVRRGETITRSEIDHFDPQSAGAEEGRGAESKPRPTVKVRAIRVDGDTVRINDKSEPVGVPNRHITVWLSDDRDRVLLRIEAETDIGHALLELTGYVAPHRAAERHPELPGLTISK